MATQVAAQDAAVHRFSVEDVIVPLIDVPPVDVSELLGR
jgi:hypothetical protein